jgi:hypothetical protein
MYDILITYLCLIYIAHLICIIFIIWTGEGVIRNEQMQQATLEDQNYEDEQELLNTLYTTRIRYLYVHVYVYIYIYS